MKRNFRSPKQNMEVLDFINAKMDINLKEQTRRSVDMEIGQIQRQDAKKFIVNSQEQLRTER